MKLVKIVNKFEANGVLMGYAEIVNPLTPFLMDYSKGGRGKKAPYETTHVRVPVPIKPLVDQMVEAYKAGEDIGQNSLTVSLPAAIGEAHRILRQKKSARVSLENLLTCIYGEQVKL